MTTYVLHLEGHLDRHWTGWFGDLTITHEADGTTTLVGPVADQAQLHGLLAKVRDLGIPLIGVGPMTGVPAIVQASAAPADRDGGSRLREVADDYGAPPGRPPADG